MLSARKTDAPDLSEADVTRIAAGLKANYGADAELIARQWAATVALAGNAQRAEAWLRVVALVSPPPRKPAIEAAA